MRRTILCASNSLFLILSLFTYHFSLVYQLSFLPKSVISVRGKLEYTLSWRNKVFCQIININQIFHFTRKSKLEEITQDYIIYQDEYLRWMVNNLNLVTFRFPFLSIYPFVSTQTLLSINVTTDTLTLLLQSTYSTCTILYSIKTRVNN